MVSIALDYARVRVFALGEPSRTSLTTSTMSKLRASDKEERVAAGLGVCFLPEHAAVFSGVIGCPVVLPSVVRKVCLVTVAGRRASSPVKAFVETLACPSTLRSLRLPLNVCSGSWPCKSRRRQCVVESTFGQITVKDAKIRKTVRFWLAVSLAWRRKAPFSRPRGLFRGVVVRALHAPFTGCFEEIRCGGARGAAKS
jgi:hypothetical protein